MKVAAAVGAAAAMWLEIHRRRNLRCEAGEHAAEQRRWPAQCEDLGDTSISAVEWTEAPSADACALTLPPDVKPPPPLHDVRPDPILLTGDSPITPASASSASRAGRTRFGSVRTAGDRQMLRAAPFSPAIAHWEFAQRTASDLDKPGAIDFDTALLFVDIRCCATLPCSTVPRVRRERIRSEAARA